MLKIGCHLSASGGFLRMGKEIVSIGGNTFQFFTRNPRGGSAKAVDEKDAADFRAFAEKNGIPVILAHAPYTLNGCSADPSIRDFATRTMADDLMRME
jgi:deoxyribonuclease-4